MKKITLLLFVFLGFQSSVVFCQEKPIQKEEKKVVVIKKVVDKNGQVNVEKIVKEGSEADALLEEMDLNIEMDVDIEEQNGVVKKRYKMVKTDENGEEQIIEWNGEGDMPEELKGHLQNENIQIEHSNLGFEGVYSIEVDSEVMGEGGENQMKVIIKSDDGNKVIEWQGDGDMPEEIMKQLSDEDIFIINGDNPHLHKEGHVNVTVEDLIEGDNQKVKIVIENEDGEQEIIEWEGDGEIPEDIKEKLDKYNVHMLPGEGAFEMELEDIEDKMNKAFLGVHIENDDLGALIIKVEDNSAAQLSELEEGDIITSINDSKVAGIESLIEALSPFAPEDEVTVQFIRDGKNSQVKSVLKERPDSNKNIWIEKDQFGLHKKENNVFFFSDDDNKHVTKKKVIIIKRQLDEDKIEKEIEEEANTPVFRGKVLKLTGFNAFPNPTDDVINVTFVAEKSPIVVQVYDISGKEVYKNEIQNFDGYFNEDINLGRFSQGSYILYVIQNDSVFSHNIVLN